MGASTYLGMGSRLVKEPSSALAESAFQSELDAAPYLMTGLSIADMAHVAMLVRARIVPPTVGVRVLTALIEVHREGPAAIALDPYVGDPYNNRDAALRERIGDDSGIIHTGRARREAATIAWQIACRERLIELGASLARFGANLVQLATDHRRTYMPDFTYLHHAHPTTLAHYLLGYGYPVARDLVRVERAYAVINHSPAGSGSVNGSRLPLDRDYLAEFLEFDRLIEHTRDAMWAPDLVIETASTCASIMTTLDRLAEELQLWTTQEFGFVELDDSHCRTSVIMPQKKNPYGLAYVRGRARDVIGRLAGLVATGLTPSGQPDNRIFAYVVVPETIDHVTRCARLMADILAGATFDRDRMRAAAELGYSYATDLCDFLIASLTIDNRTAHRVIGRAVRAAIADGDVPLTGDHVRAAARELDVDLDRVDDAEIDRIRDVEQLVAARSGTGGAGDEPVERMLADLRARIGDAARLWAEHPQRGFETRVLDRVVELTRQQGEQP